MPQVEEETNGKINAKLKPKGNNRQYLEIS